MLLLGEERFAINLSVVVLASVGPQAAICKLTAVLEKHSEHAAPELDIWIPGAGAPFPLAGRTHAHDMRAVNEDLCEMAAVFSLIDEYLGVSNINMRVRAGVAKTGRVLVLFHRTSGGCTRGMGAMVWKPYGLSRLPNGRPQYALDKPPSDVSL